MHSSQFLVEEQIVLEGQRTLLLWESVGRKLREAQLTADQIQQLFTAAEQGATTAGGNRTLLGKGKDAAMAVNQAWEDLKTKIQNSAPIANADAAYDGAVAKIEAGLGGPDNKVNQVIQKYRKFAKEHPIAQSFIYAALIAAAGISGAGLGGAAVLGLLKMTDKLLQGDKFSSAAYSGAKTGAMAYAAGQIGKAIKGDQAPAGGKPNGGLDPNDADVAEFNRDVQDTVDASNKLPGGSGTLVGGQPVPVGTKIPPHAGMDFDKYDYYVGPKGGQYVVPKGGVNPLTMDNPQLDQMAQSATSGAQDAATTAAQRAATAARSAASGTTQAASDTASAATQSIGGFASDPNLSPIQAKIAALIDAGKPLNKNQMDFLYKAMDTAAQKSSMLGDMPDGTANAGMRQLMSLQNLANAAKTESVRYIDHQKTILEQKSNKRSARRVHLTPAGVQQVFAEGAAWDAIKKSVSGVAGAIGQKVATVGKNLTTKVTADKLNTAWKKAKSPTDSAAVAQIMTDAGIPSEVVNQSFTSIGVEAPPLSAATQPPAVPDAADTATQQQTAPTADAGTAVTSNGQSTGKTKTSSGASAIAQQSGGSAQQQKVARSIDEEIDDLMRALRKTDNILQPAYIKYFRDVLDRTFGPAEKAVPTAAADTGTGGGIASVPKTESRRPRKRYIKETQAQQLARQFEAYVIGQV